MKVEWIKSKTAKLEVDEAEYMMLASAITMCLRYPLPFENIHKDFVEGLELRNILKQKERKSKK
jgi:hypothetical protein